ncbi:hypothetical protein BCR44DRAFT_97725 [Catenaria anguillulae PL171]|uniref:Myb/SANT-like domain-containing protein n=1 Tax=Catenaria anguillulae PL171 TaxID=765915 RepID=A0A1Y2H452_9FUNG|nr:hypothetical protein BCR44DRAFT_97725 [Catenaria anguillulae PL171]
MARTKTKQSNRKARSSGSTKTSKPLPRRKAPTAKPIRKTSKVRWSRDQTRFVVKCLKRYKRKGVLGDGNILKAAHCKEIADQLVVKYRRDFTSTQVKNHVNALKALYRVFHKYRTKTGWNWDPDTYTIIVDEDVFQAEADASPDCKPRLLQPFEQCDDLHEIYGGTSATGDHALGVDQPLGSDKDEDMEDQENVGDEDEDEDKGEDEDEGEGEDEEDEEDEHDDMAGEDEHDDMAGEDEHDDMAGGEEDDDMAGEDEDEFDGEADDGGDGDEREDGGSGLDFDGDMEEEEGAGSQDSDGDVENDRQAAAPTKPPKKKPVPVTPKYLGGVNLEQLPPGVTLTAKGKLRVAKNAVEIAMIKALSEVSKPLPAMTPPHHGYSPRGMASPLAASSSLPSFAPPPPLDCPATAVSAANSSNPLARVLAWVCQRYDDDAENAARICKHLRDNEKDVEMMDHMTPELRPSYLRVVMPDYFESEPMGARFDFD